MTFLMTKNKNTKYHQLAYELVAKTNTLTNEDY